MPFSWGLLEKSLNSHRGHLNLLNSKILFCINLKGTEWSVEMSEKQSFYGGWTLSWGPHQEFPPTVQQNSIAHRGQVLSMADSASMSPSLLTAPWFRAAVNSVPSDTVTSSHIPVTRGSHITYSGHVHMGELWELCGSVCFLPSPIFLPWAQTWWVEPYLISCKQNE